MFLHRNRRELLATAGTALLGGVTHATAPARANDEHPLDVRTDFERIAVFHGGGTDDGRRVSVRAVVARPRPHTGLDRDRVRVVRTAVGIDRAAHETVEITIAGRDGTELDEDAAGSLAIGPPRTVRGDTYTLRFAAGVSRTSRSPDRALTVPAVSAPSTPDGPAVANLTEPSENRFRVQYEFDDAGPATVGGTAVFDTTDTDEYADAVQLGWSVEPGTTLRGSSVYTHVEGTLS